MGALTVETRGTRTPFAGANGMRISVSTSQRITSTIASS